MRSWAGGGVLWAVGLVVLACSDGGDETWGAGLGGGSGGAPGWPQLPLTSGSSASDPGGAGQGSAGVAGPVDTGCLAPPCAAPFEILFASEQLPSFFLTIPDGGDSGATNSWSQLEACDGEDLRRDPPPPECDYQPATFHAEYDPNPYDGVVETLQSAELAVGVRLKGRASFRPIGDKPAFKVKFTEAAAEGEGRRFLGLSRLTLNNMVQDPSGIRERLAYRVYRDVGVEAPLANSARVYVKRGAGGSYEYYGLYANVQTLDRRFVEYRFGEVGGEAGNLYDTKNVEYFSDFDRSRDRQQAGTEPGAQEQRFQLETNDVAPDTSDLTAAIDAVFVDDIEATASQLFTDTALVIDVAQWLRVAAAQALLADWDGFAGARNNYKAYRDLVRAKFVILPWGTDQTFGYIDGYRPNWHYALTHESSERGRPLFFLRCLGDTAACSNDYMRIVADVAARFDTQALLAEAEHARLQVEQALLEDERKPHDDDQSRSSAQHVSHFIQHRMACVGRLIQHQQCEQLECPAGADDDCRR
jgi:hypothetical protein